MSGQSSCGAAYMRFINSGTSEIGDPLASSRLEQAIGGALC